MSTKPQQLEATLPRECYLSDAHFRRERDVILYREWFCVGRVEGLEKKGNYRVIDVLGESLLLVRDEGASIRAFNNVCRHRGAELIPAGRTEQQTGSFVAGIRCPIIPGTIASMASYTTHRTSMSTNPVWVYIRLRPTHGVVFCSFVSSRASSL